MDSNSRLLHPGLYDDLLTYGLQEEIARLDRGVYLPIVGKIESAVLPDYLTRFVAARLSHAFSCLDDDATGRQIALANAVLELLSSRDPSLEHLLLDRLALEDEVDRLEEIAGTSNAPATLRPLTELSASSLLTGTPGLPQLGGEIERELASADRVDFLVAFVKTGGLRLLRGPLRRFVERGGKLRLITTSYLGASDPIAIEEIAALPNTEVRIHYDTKAERLHAKAYFFHRDSGLSTAYIGSANLSHSAMTRGLEWTVKVASRELPDLFRRCCGEFTSYWENPAFEIFDPAKPERFRAAVRRERGDFAGFDQLLVTFDLSPHDYQIEILNDLQTARDVRGHFRNLVVAATGTGKTMISAFDYRRLADKQGRRPTLLYIAHRKEILQQALSTFRQVLRDGNYGGLLVDSETPEGMDHVFCSIQSFLSKKLAAREGPTRWDYVVLDEAHHAEARSYETIVQELRPSVLLGLTATPERSDGTSVAAYFDTPLAAEIRLPDALQDGLLCPFHYFAVTDYTVDFSTVSWRSGRYDDRELENLLTGNHLRAQLVLDKLREYLPDPYGSGEFDKPAVRALGFCVSVKHAEFMASFFRNAGITAAALTGKTPREERNQLRQDLAEGRINLLFVVDVFNEGVDIPIANCVLFLRPTESHVVFLQQLGRGLRKHEKKDNLTVLDFVGQCRREFRYDLRFSSLLPGRRHRLVDEIEGGFPHLPSGCAIVMERQARETILTSVRRTYQQPELRISEAFRLWPEDQVPSFASFIETTGEDPVELLRRASWSDWKAKAGHPPIPGPDADNDRLDKALARVSMQRAPRYLDWLARLAVATTDQAAELVRDPIAAVAYHLLWNTPAGRLGVTTLEDAFLRLLSNHNFRSDLSEVVEWSRLRSPLPSPRLSGVPDSLELHGFYSATELNAAYGKTTIQGGGARGTGVVFLHDHKTVLHFVTFEKTEKLFSPSTLYRDYPTRPDLLHWESQSNTTQASSTGRLYANHLAQDYRILFFSRIRKHVATQVTSPFLFLGPADFVEATGNRPIQIVWQLEHAMPIAHYREARAACGIEG